MPGRQKIQVKGFDEARRKLKNIRDNALRKRIIVSAAKNESKPTLAKMKAGLSKAVLDGDILAEAVLGQRTIPVTFGGKGWPGAWTGVKKKSEYSIKPSRGRALSIYWVEFGTSEREQERTGRSTGKFPEFAPMRKAISKTHSVVRRGFRSELIAEINKRIRKNKI